MLLLFALSLRTTQCLSCSRDRSRSPIDRHVPRNELRFRDCHSSTGAARSGGLLPEPSSAFVPNDMVAERPKMVLGTSGSGSIGGAGFGGQSFKEGFGGSAAGQSQHPLVPDSSFFGNPVMPVTQLLV